MVLSLAIMYNYWRYLFFGPLRPSNNGLNSESSTIDQSIPKNVRTSKKLQLPMMRSGVFQ